MATKIQPPSTPLTIPKPKAKPKRVCFSFAAYAKNLIDNLKNSNVPIANGLTEAEFSTISSTFNFTFPPDLRSILGEGLPVGQGFPNWRTSSPQQLQTLINLPILGLCNEISKQIFWHKSWGEKPEDGNEAVKVGKTFLKKSPVLVPIYRQFYIPSKPCLSGNPVFYVNGCDVKRCSFDLVGFFQQVEFKQNEGILRRPSLANLLSAPAWAATEARDIEFWTELAERRGTMAAHRTTRRWWSGGDLGGRLEEVFWLLRNGGWREEDVREMMMMDGGGDGDGDGIDHDFDKRSYMGVVWHVRVLSLRLLRAGWSNDDVVDSLGILADDEETCFELVQTNACDDE